MGVWEIKKRRELLGEDDIGKKRKKAKEITSLKNARHGLSFDKPSKQS